MILYHGTDQYNLRSFQSSIPQVRLRRYIKRPSFCTTLSLHEAKLFALRKITIGDFERGDFSHAGVVLIFDGRYLQDDDFDGVQDPRASLRKEEEIAVYTPEKLRLLGYWKYEQEKWIKWVFDPDDGLPTRSAGLRKKSGVTEERSI